MGWNAFVTLTHTSCLGNQADESCGDQKDDYLREFVKAMSVGSNNLNIAYINIRSL